MHCVNLIDKSVALICQVGQLTSCPVVQLAKMQMCCVPDEAAKNDYKMPKIYNLR